MCIYIYTTYIIIIIQYLPMPFHPLNSSHPPRHTKYRVNGTSTFHHVNFLQEHLPNPQDCNEARVFPLLPSRWSPSFQREGAPLPWARRPSARPTLQGTPTSCHGGQHGWGFWRRDQGWKDEVPLQDVRSSFTYDWYLLVVVSLHDVFASSKLLWDGHFASCDWKL